MSVSPAMAAGAERSVRVGILCGGTGFQRWQAEAIRQMLAVPGVEVVVLVVDARKGPADRQPLDQLLYRKYRQYFFKPAAMDPIDLSQELSSIPRLGCTPQKRGKRELFDKEDLDAIGQYRPDVLLRFGFNILSGDILTLPTHGVWSFHHGDGEHFRGGPPGLWEIMKGSNTVGAILQRLTEDLDSGHILKKGWFGMVDHSLKETVDTVLSQTAIWPAQVLRALLSGDADAATGTPSGKVGRLYRYPGNVTFLRFLWKQFRNKLRFHKQELKDHEEWNIGVMYQPIATILDGHGSTNVRWLPAPAPDNFRADPFGYIGADGDLNVLYEKFDHNSGRGEISRVRPRKDNVLKRSRGMLNGDTHLSYPYVVQREGQVYVIPENAASGRVILYKLQADNEGLDPAGTLLEEPLFDPTLFEYGGRWWLAGSKGPLTNASLYLYHSDAFEGPYLPHMLNPVKFDIRSARPAGTPFVHEGQLWRPAQDSSHTYGGRIALNRIIELTPERFKEETVKFFGPIKGSAYDKGLHTVAAVGDLTLVDGKRFVTVKQRRAMVSRRKLEKLKHLGLS